MTAAEQLKRAGIIASIPVIMSPGCSKGRRGSTRPTLLTHEEQVCAEVRTTEASYLKDLGTLLAPKRWLDVHRRAATSPAC